MSNRLAVSGRPMNNADWSLLVLLSVLWGGSFFFFKVMLEELKPISVVLARVGLAALILNSWLLVRGNYMSRSFADWRAFLVMGVINNVIPFSLIVFGETRISSGLASILNATTPVFTIIVAHFLTQNEKMNYKKMAGIALAFAGVMILVGPNASERMNGSELIGIAACLIAALSYALAGVYGRRFRGQSPLKVATGQLTASSIVLLVLVLAYESQGTFAFPSVHVMLATLGIALFSTVFAYVLYFRILSSVGATNLLLVTFLLPVSALILGWAVLDEDVTGRSIIGMAVIGLGLAAIDGRVLHYSASLFASRSGIVPHDPRGSDDQHRDGSGI